MANENKIKYQSPFQHIMKSALGIETQIDNEKYLYFAGVGYYHLQSDKEVTQAAISAIEKYGMGSATTRAITGTTPLLLDVEKVAAEYFGTEDAAYLPSGYLSNIAGIEALNKLKKFDVIFIDEDSHYCNIEAAYTVNKPVFTFKNRDVNNLKQSLLKNLNPGFKPLIATDGMFPIWAKLAPVSEYLEIANKYNGVVWIDDAHPVGIIGDKGRGTYDYFKLLSERLYMGATLSKAFGAYGGIIPGNAEFIHAVKTGSVITGSSAPLSAAAASAKKGIELVMNNQNMRLKLWENARYLKSRLNTLGISTDDNYFPIVTFLYGDAKQMKTIQQSLMKKGIYIQLAKYKGSGSDGVLRIVVSSKHEKTHIDFLISALKSVL